MFYINSPSVLLFWLISTNISPSLIMFHLFFFRVFSFLCISALHICLVYLYFLPLLVKIYICHVAKIGFNQRQPSCPSSLFFISLVATYTCLLRQWLEILNLRNSTILLKIFWIFTTFREPMTIEGFGQQVLIFFEDKNFVWISLCIGYRQIFISVLVYL